MIFKFVPITYPLEIPLWFPNFFATTLRMINKHMKQVGILDRMLINITGQIIFFLAFK